MEAIGRDHSRRQGRFYGCAYHRKRGTSICRNTFRIEQHILDRIVLEVVNRAFDADLVQEAIEAAVRQLIMGQEEQRDRQMALEHELSQIETRQQNLAEAIARGEAIDPLLVLLKAEDARKEALCREPESLNRPGG